MAVFAIGCVLATASLAAPSAGTTIHNQALATFTYAGETAPSTIFSNQVYAIVQPVAALTLTQNNDLQRPAGSTVTFTHLLTNTGNVPASYQFSWDTSGCNTPNLGFSGTVNLYLDVNANGFFDPNDRNLTLEANTSTPTFPPSVTLGAGEAANLLLQGTLPLAANGSTSCIRLIAKLSGSSLQAQNLDTVRITSSASVIVNKSVTYSGLAQPGYTVLTYTLNASNIGDTNADPTGTVPGPVTVLVNGLPRSLVLIRDKIPAGAHYVAGSLNTAAYGALRLFRLAGDADFTYYTTPTVGTGRDDIAAIEVAIGLPTSLKSSSSVSMDFKVKLLNPAPSLVSNTAWVDFNDGTAPAESVSNTVVVKTTSQILGLAKAANVPVAHVDANGAPDGTATVRFQVLARNYGAGTLYEAGIRDVLENVPAGLGAYTTATIPAIGQYTVVANSVRMVSQSGAGTVATIVSDFTGQSNHAELLSSHAILPPNGSVTVQFDVRFNVTNMPATLYNSAGGHAATVAFDPDSVIASSVNGTDPDMYHDGNPNAHSSPTPYKSQLPTLRLLKTVFPPRLVSKGVYDVDIALKVTNESNVVATNVQLVDNLYCAFDKTQPNTSAIDKWQITVPPRSLNGLLLPSSMYTGGANYVSCDRASQDNPDAMASFSSEPSVGLIDGQHSLRSGESETLTMTVQVTLKNPDSGKLTVVTNKAWAGIFLPQLVNGLPVLTWATSNTASAAMADPSGVVYNSVTRQPVAAAVVTMKRESCTNTPVTAITAAELFGDSSIYTFNADGSVATSTDATGSYFFVLKVPPVNDLCTYSLKVAPPAASGLVYPSILIAAHADKFATCGNVSPVLGAPALGQDTTYYNKVVAGKNGSDVCEVFNNNIPLDPKTSLGGLTLQKSASSATVEVGDIVTFTLKVNNLTNAALTQLAIKDQLPPGFRYVPGSSRVSGLRVGDPEGGVGPNLVFNLPLSASTVLENAQSMELRYQVRVGVSTPVGVDAINRAWALTGGASNPISSNEADARMRVIGGVFATEAYAFGKVFLDCNKNGIQDEAELGIPGVRLFMEDGTGVVTDIEGKWSLYGLRPVTHALRLDTSTLPEGSELALIEPRQSGQADSVFLDLKNGEWHKANFAVQNCERTGLVQAINARRDAIVLQPGSEGESSRANTRLTPDGKIVATGDIRGLPSAGTIDSTGSLKSSTTISSPLISLPGSVSGSDFATAAPLDSTFVPISAPIITPPLTASGTLQTPEGFDSAPVEEVAALEDVLQSQDRKLGFMGLQDQQVLPTGVSNVRVKGSVGSRLVLSVNGQIVDENRVGKRAVMETKQLQAWEYIAVQFQPGVNTLKVQEVDTFGNQRGVAEIQVSAPGALAKIAIETVATAKADERTPVNVKIRLLDAQGLPVTDRIGVTLESIATRWTATDLNPMEAGVQVMVEGGSATFQLIPPANPGDGKIRVSVGTLQTEARIIFLPDLRPLTGIGVLEGVLNLRNPGNMPLGAPRASDAFESELRGLSDQNGDSLGTARSAFYFKGAVKGEYLLTAAYDSDKTTATSMFRDIQPDQFYPIYGDSSAKIFDAQSSQRFYVRVDKNRSYLLYGDFNTAASPEVRKLSQGSRTGTGLQHVYNSEDLRVTSHYSRDSLKQVVEEFTANGTSGPYALSKSEGSDLFVNSETVQIVVRDRNQTNSVLSTTTLTRFVDYSIQPLSKTILFSRPISSLDSDLNPQSVRVNYVVDTGGPAFDVGGVDVQLRLSDRLQIGTVAEYDTAPGSSRRLVAATVLAKLDENTVLSGELVSTTSDIKGEGFGGGIELRHDDSLLKYNLHVQASDAGFDNPSAAIVSGHTEARGHLDYQLNTENHLKAEFVYTQDNNQVTSAGLSNNVQTQGVSLAVQTKVSPNVTTEVGVRAGQTDTSASTGFDYGSSSGGSTGNVAAAATGVNRETLTARARVSVKVPEVPNAQVFVEGEQDVNDSTRHSTSIGGNYAINDKARVYGRYEVVSSLGSQYDLTNTAQRNVGLVGVESAYMQGGRLYDEYRIADTIDGRAMQSAMGVRNTFEVTESLRLTGGLEQVSALPGPNGTSTGESKAITGAFDWLGAGEYKNRLRGSGSAEFRQATDSTSGLLSMGLAYKLDPDWSVLTRATVNSVSNLNDGSVHWLEREQIGFAYRPVDQDVWNSLFRYEHKADTWQGVVSATAPLVSTTTDIFSAHLNYQPWQQDILSARYATKQSATTSDGLRSTYGAHLLYGRWTHDISQDWDFGVQAGLLLGDGGTQQHTVGAELGYQLSQGLWISGGYNVLGLHDPDLAGADYTDSGFYLRLRFKFDERLFQEDKSKLARAH